VDPRQGERLLWWSSTAVQYTGVKYVLSVEEGSGGVCRRCILQCADHSSGSAPEFTGSWQWAGPVALGW